MTLDYVTPYELFTRSHDIVATSSLY